MCLGELFGKKARIMGNAPFIGEDGTNNSYPE